MPIRTRQWTDLGDADDGLRVLVCRYRPRGLPKGKETWNVWDKELAPSVELHAAYWGKHGAPIGWDEYRRRYLDEMRAQSARIAELAARVRAGETVTLLCSSACTDEEHCHRTLLAALIDRAAR